MGGATPTPVRETVLVPAFVVSPKLPLDTPATVGWNAIRIVQEPPAGIGSPQNPPAIENPLPVRVKALAVTGNVPVLVNWSSTGGKAAPSITLPKSTLVGVKVAIGAAIAVPVSDAVSVTALSDASRYETSNVPEIAPVDSGANTAGIVQNFPAGNCAPAMQVAPLAIWKGSVESSAMVILVSVIAKVLLFVTVKVFGELV